MPGISTTTSSSSEATKIHGEAFSQKLTGICTVTSAATSAIATNRIWRVMK